MTHRPAARRLLAAGVAPLLLALAACSGSSGPAAGTGAPAASAAASGEASGGASPAPAGGTGAKVDSGALSQKMVAALRENRTARVRMTTTTPDGDLTAKGVVRFGPKKTSMRVAFSSSGQDMAMVLDGPVFYFQAPGLAGRWIKISADGDDQFSKAFAPVLESMSANTSLERTAAAVEALELTEVGPADVDGIAVTEYSYPVTPESVRASLPKGTKVPDAELEGISGTVTMAVDDQGLVHRVVSDTRSPQGDSTVTVRYLRWGDPVKIPIPGKSQLVPVPGA